MSDMKKDSQNETTKQTSSGKGSLQNRKFRSGAYVSAVSAVVVVLVIMINILVSQFQIQLDVSSQSMYTVTDTTKNLLKNLEDNITIYVLAESGGENAINKKILTNYERYSSKVKIIVKDPVLYPKFASQYTTEEVTENSIIVVNESNKKSVYIPYEKMREYNFDYTTLKNVATGVDVEGQVTSAIQTVIDDTKVVIYEYSGHGEQALGDTIKTAMEKQNYELKTLENTISLSAIPEDCSLLILNGPSADLTNEEYEVIKAYLANGGKMIIGTDYYSQGLTNFTKLLEYYGVKMAEGIVMEGKSGMYMVYPNYLLPTVESHDITQTLIKNRKSVMVIQGCGLNISETYRSSLTIEPLLTTSSDAFSRIDINSSQVTKLDEDIAGPFYIGLKVSDYYNQVTTDLIIFGSSYLVHDTILEKEALGNCDLFLQSIGNLTGKQSSSNIPVKSSLPSYLTVATGQFALWTVITCVALPVIILVIGIVICVRRRRR